MAHIPDDLQRVLGLKNYGFKECIAAIRGERIPRAMGFTVTRLCVIRGIRYHPGFAKELHGTAGEFTRALNARDIMSNIIPEMNHPDEFPYCIWYPDVASEETYRALARRYPQLAYNVGRACAVAGYVELFRELELLPEVHIAEEARESGNTMIFDLIMASDNKYAVMNDYTRTVNLEHPPKASINGDTAVKSLLDFKQKPWKPHNSLFSFNEGYQEHMFNITEDFGMDEYESKSTQTEDVAHLLYNPLPADLPTIHKDLLILMAAYYGDIDRYTRLRRPSMIPDEVNCVVRGIFHNTMFAKWWSLQQATLQKVNKHSINRAINARFIMSNDLSRITADTANSDLPYCIWYPARAHWSTYEELVRRKPTMTHEVARACIIADYESTYDTLNVVPDVVLLREARESPNPHYLRDLEGKVAEPNDKHDEGWKKYTRKDHFEPTSTHLYDVVSTGNVGTGFEFIYEGLSADVSHIELNVCAPAELKKKKEGEYYHDLYRVD